MSGRLENLNAYQANVLKEFRTSLRDVLKPEHDDRYLLMFLRARSFVKDDAETMIREHFRWRRHFSKKFFLTEYTPPEVLDLYAKILFLGHDFEGSLVNIFVIGRVDLKGILKSANDLDIITYLACILTLDIEALNERNKQLGTNVETVVYIADFDELCLYDLPIKYTVSLIIRCLKLAEANFPERLKSVFLINCPSAIHLVIKVLLPFLSDTTAGKIKIFGKDGYKEEFLKTIDSKLLPAYLGGTRVDTEEDRTCERLVSAPVAVPKSYYFQNKTKLDASKDGVNQINIAKRSFVCIDINVAEPDHAILWEVEIQTNDLAIGLFIKENNSLKEKKMKSVKPTKKFKSQYSPIVGHHVCDTPGTYVLMFDNRYSYFTDKIVLYHIKVIPPFD